MSEVREKFSSQLPADLLEQARELARTEGRQLQSVLEQALSEYLARHEKASVRREVLEALGSSLEEFDDLYRALAK